MKGFTFINEPFLFLLYKLSLFFIIKSTINKTGKINPEWRSVCCCCKSKELISNNQKFKWPEIICVNFF